MHHERERAEADMAERVGQNDTYPDKLQLPIDVGKTKQDF